MTDSHDCNKTDEKITSYERVSRSDLVFQKLKKYEEKYMKRKQEALPIRAYVLADSESDSERKLTNIAGSDHLKNFVIKRTKSTDSEEATTEQNTLNWCQANKDRPVEEPVNNYCCSSANDSSLDIPINKQSPIKSSNYGKIYLQSFGVSETHIIENVSPDISVKIERMPVKNYIGALNEATRQKLCTKTACYSGKIQSNFVSLPDEDMNNHHINILPYDSNCELRNDIKSSEMYQSRTPPVGEGNCGSSRESDLNISLEMMVNKQLSQSSHTYQKQQINRPTLINSMPLPPDRGEESSDLESIKTETFNFSNMSKSQEFSEEISNLVHIVMAEKSESLLSDKTEAQEASVTNDNRTSLSENEQKITSSMQDVKIGVKSSRINQLCVKCNRTREKYNKNHRTETYDNYITRATQTDSAANILHPQNNIFFPEAATAEAMFLPSHELSLYNYLLHPETDKGCSDDDPAASMLNKMLLEQVSLTQHFMSSQYAMYNAHCVSVRTLSNSYQPVTLENTKKFIKDCKKKKQTRMVSS